MIRIAICGLGRMGSSYLESSGIPRSHIGAILKRNDMEIVAIIDCKKESILSAQNLWPDISNVPAYMSLEQIPEGSADVIILSTPPQDRLLEVQVSISKKIKLLIIEKPIALDSITAHKIQSIVHAAQLPVRVNFHRRFDTQYQLLKSQLTATPKKVVMYYNKGLYNYASHLIDFLFDWFGAIESVFTFSSQGVENPSFTCHMTDGFDVVVVGIDSLEYDQFEVEIFYSDSKVELANGGCQKSFQFPKEGLFYPGYKQLDQRVEVEASSPVAGLMELYLAISDHFYKNKELSGCDENEALNGIAVLEAVELSCESGKREFLHSL